MRTRLHCSTLCVLILVAATAASAQQQYPFQDPALPAEQRIDNLLSLMTLEEKIKCLGTHPDVPRLGVHASGHVEGLHGLAMGGPGGWGRPRVVPTTQFPQAVGLGETWDPALLRRAAAAEALEARYIFQSEKYHQGGLVVRAPNADLARDPRWGRTEESYGEDPFLTGTMAVAFVRGLQGDDPKYWETASLLKHFFANSNENGRGGSSSNFDERLMREYYSVPFRMGIVEGGARAFMAAYNAWNGIPMTVQPILRQMAIDQWGQNGIICTDAGALTNLVTQHHRYADIEQAAADAVKAGINQFLDKYSEPVHGAVQHGLLTEAEIDRSLRGVFRVMIRLGLLDPPEMVPYSRIGSGPEPWAGDEHKALARLVTQKSIVLLKNENNALPLDRTKLKSIAVIGPYADRVLLDWYSGTPPYTVSALEGIRNAAGAAVRVQFAANNDADAAVALARTSDVAIVVVGNHPECDAGWEKCPAASNGKEAVDRQSITLEQEDLVRAVYGANRRTIVVLIANFPYAINWSQQNVPAILHMTHNSEELGNALADVLFGDVNPGGKLVHTWPASIEQLPPMMDYNLRDGRTYMYFRGKPLYPFGYGLSYTTFKLSHMRVHDGRVAPEGTIRLTVDVENTGKRAGDEVVQLYVRYRRSKVERPALELKAFQRITVQPHEKKTIDLAVPAQSLAYWNTSTGKFVVEPGKIDLLAGDSSANLPLKAGVTVEAAKE